MATLDATIPKFQATAQELTPYSIARSYLNKRAERLFDA